VVLHSPLPRLLTGALVVVVGTTLASPSFAAPPATHPIRAAAAAKVAALPMPALAQAQAPSAPAAANGEKPFLKTAKGQLAAALLAGALGYTFYSFSHDRVKSPER
jgi:hypothetical protein